MADVTDIDIGFLQVNRYSPLKDVLIYKKRSLESRAVFACAMMERWGMVAGEVDGEDSAGRQKVRLSTPAELIQRACDVANGAFDEFEKRGWVLKIPPPTVEKDK